MSHLESINEDTVAGGPGPHFHMGPHGALDHISTWGHMGPWTTFPHGASFHHFFPVHFLSLYIIIEGEKVDGKTQLHNHKNLMMTDSLHYTDYTEAVHKVR